MCSTRIFHSFLILILAAGALLTPPRPAAAHALPEQAYVSGVVGRSQSYALSCESRSASDLAAFWGVSVSEVEFLKNLPKSDNPEKGFVGNFNDPWGYVPPRSYGVHARPVAKQLQKFGLDADHHKGMSWKDLRAEIAAGRPVIVWVIGGVWQGTPVTYHPETGKKTIVASYEHTMILIGYDATRVHLIDSGTGYTVTHPVNNFRASWAVLEHMAVTVNGNPKKTEDPKKEDNNKKEDDKKEEPAKKQDQGNGGTYTVKPGDYLTKLASKWGTSWQDLAALNKISYPYIIYVGQVLKKPGGAEAKPEEPKPAKPPPEPTKEPPKKPEKPPKDEVASSGETYTVKKGDHLMKIARALKLDWQAMAQLNGLSPPYVLYPGQVLKLPGSGAGEPPPPPAKEPEPEKDTSQASEDVPDKYTVQKGDYLVALARRFGLNWQTLAAINGISYPYIVHPGQVLKLK